MDAPHDHGHSRRLLPPLSALAAFEAVARRASFTAAAQELALTQSAVSRQVSGLEALLGVALFEGNRRKRVSLTPSGVFYAERARQILSNLAAATTEAISLGGKGRSLRLGIPPTFGSRWLIPRMHKFLAMHPDIQLEFTTRVPGRPIPLLAELDAVIDFAPAPGSTSEWHQLMTLELAAVTTPELAQRFRQAHEAPPAKTHLLVHATERHAVHRILRDPGMRLLRNQAVLTFESYGMLFQAAQTGLGVGLAPTAFISNELASTILVPINTHPVPSSTIGYLVYASEKASYPPLRAFRSWLFAAATSS